VLPHVDTCKSADTFSAERRDGQPMQLNRKVSGDADELPPCRGIEYILYWYSIRFNTSCFVMADLLSKPRKLPSKYSM